MDAQLDRIADGIGRKFPQTVTLRLATLGARKRLADDEIGTCVKQGLFQVHRYHYPKGKRHGSKSNSRKAASAMIAKIPLPLALHIARTFKPIETEGMT